MNSGANYHQGVAPTDEHARPEAVEPVSVETPNGGRALSEQPTAMTVCLKLSIEGKKIAMNTNLADACRSHPWRRATIRRHCRLCLQQCEMRARWKKIRQALRTMSHYSLRPAVKLEPPPPTGIWRASTSALTSGAELDHKLLVINCEQLILQVGPSNSR